MPKLTFVIPTNNRPKELDICVRSIATQIRSEMDVNIIILDDGSATETHEVCDVLTGFYPFIEARHLEKHKDYSDIFRTMFRASPESEWVWTFGDDDKLQPRALEFMLKQLDERPDAKFFHIAEVSRASGAQGAFVGTLLDLCRNFGWIDMTGFITGNITRGDWLHKASETPRWKEYARNSFVQSCALLECLKDEPAVFLDLPLIDTQNRDMTQDTINRWAKNRIAARYQYLSLAVERMFDDGILTAKLPAKFFRYLSYHMWDRFLTYMPSDYIDKGQMWSEDSWGNVARFAQFIEEEDIAKRIVQDVEAARGLITLHYYQKQNLDGILGAIAEISTRRGEGCYTWTFADPNANVQSQPDKPA